MKTMLRTSALCAALVLVPALPVSDPAGTEEAGTTEIPEGLELDEGWYARFDTTMGPFLVRLLPEQAPQAVAHFAALAEGRLAWNDPFTGEEMKTPYYDGIAVHKVVAGQRFEAGDRTGTGMGAFPVWIPLEGPGRYNFRSPWRIGMTRASRGRISGSLFFVTAASQPFLDGRHPCFGTVVHGKESILRMTAVKAYSNGKPIEDVVLERVRILRVGEPDPLPEPEPYKPKRRSIQQKKRSPQGNR
jgi:cyclophilin family peptidyl-prolyl cis-trans isomerase